MPTTRKKSTKAPDEKTVLSFLSGNPDFLLRHQEIFAHLVTPARQLGDGVSDFQRFMVDRLKSQVQELRDTQQALIAAGHANDMSLNRIHGAALRLVEADNLETLGAIITDELPALCGVDSAVIGLERESGTDTIVTLDPGQVEGWLGPADTMLRAHTTGMPELFGDTGGTLRSIALMRLEPDADTLGVLAFGSRDPEWFTPDQGTDLVSFLTGLITRQIRKLTP